MPMNRPTCVESMMMRLSSLADRQLGVGADQPGRVGEVDRMQGRLQRRLADDGVIDATGLDLHLVVVVGASPAG